MKNSCLSFSRTFGLSLKNREFVLIEQVFKKIKKEKKIFFFDNTFDCLIKPYGDRYVIGQSMNISEYFLKNKSNKEIKDSFEGKITVDGLTFLFFLLELVHFQNLLKNEESYLSFVFVEGKEHEVIFYFKRKKLYVNAIPFDKKDKWKEMNLMILK